MADQMIESITGMEVGGDDLSVEYVDIGKPIIIVLHFHRKATLTAEQIATQFQEHAGIPVEVEVNEIASSYLKDTVEVVQAAEQSSKSENPRPPARMA